MGERTYRFAPHPARGFLLGLRIPQLAGLVLAGLLALAALHIGGGGALALALCVPGFAAAILLTPLRSQTLEQWLPILLRFGLSRLSSRSRFRAQRAQLGHVVTMP